MECGCHGLCMAHYSGPLWTWTAGWQNRRQPLVINFRPALPTGDDKFTNFKTQIHSDDCSLLSTGPHVTVETTV